MGFSHGRWIARPTTYSTLRRPLFDLISRNFRGPVGTDSRHTQWFRALAASHCSGGRDKAALAPRCTLPARYANGSKIVEESLHLLAQSPASLPSNAVDAGLTWEDLRDQARVEVESKSLTLLVDQAAHRENWDLWVAILDFRHRTEGLAGVQAVWKGMRTRDVDLPVNGDVAAALWTTFIHATINSIDPNVSGGRAARQNLQTLVLQYAIDLKARTGLQYHGLYKAFVGRWLRTLTQAARWWHQRLVSAGLADADDFATVAEDFLFAQDPARAVKLFRQLYRAGSRRNLYDAFVGKGLEAGVRDAQLVKYHRFFLDNGDLPSRETSHTPEFQRVISLDKEIPPQTKPSEVPLTVTAEQAHAAEDVPLISRESMSMIVGDAHGIKPKQVSDDFCAKLVATRAFSLEFIVKGLSFFGVTKLGPCTLREIAVRARNIETYRETVGALKGEGIVLDDSPYTKLMSRVADEPRSILWEVLLASDQHPEEYGDAAIQEALLRTHLQHGKWPEVHLRLTLLSILGTSASARGWNLTLQHYARATDDLGLLSTMRSMQAISVVPDVCTLTLLYRCVLWERRLGKRRTVRIGPFSPTHFVTNACVYVAEKGHRVPPHLWVELLRRYGMDFRWNQLESLVRWLVNHYGLPPSTNMTENATLRQSQHFSRSDTLQRVFSPPMLRALFYWGFRGAAESRALRPRAARRQETQAQPHPEPWAQGLHLLRHLKERGFPLDFLPRKVFIHQMWMLFGPAYSAKRFNHAMRRGNELTLAHYIRHGNVIMPGLVNLIDPELLRPEHDCDPQLLLAFFGPEKRVWKRQREFVDVAAWSQAAADGRRYQCEPLTISERMTAWKRSRFRRVAGSETHRETSRARLEQSRRHR